MPINYLELVDKMAFPATRTEIIDYALDHGATEEAVEAFKTLPQQDFKTLEELSQVIGRM